MLSEMGTPYNHPGLNYFNTKVALKKMAENAALKKKARQKLREDGVKLWDPPYTYVLKLISLIFLTEIGMKTDKDISLSSLFQSIRRSWKSVEMEHFSVNF